MLTLATTRSSISNKTHGPPSPSLNQIPSTKRMLNGALAVYLTEKKAARYTRMISLVAPAHAAIF